VVEQAKRQQQDITEYVSQAGLFGDVDPNIVESLSGKPEFDDELDKRVAALEGICIMSFWLISFWPNSNVSLQYREQFLQVDAGTLLHE
jgi:hypothetical protein